MQLGTENRNKTIAAVGLMVLALAMVVMRFFPGSPASAKTPTPVVAPPTGTRSGRWRCGPKSGKKSGIARRAFA